jgi:hypothetical protein
MYAIVYMHLATPRVTIGDSKFGCNLEPQAKKIPGDITKKFSEPQAIYFFGIKLPPTVLPVVKSTAVQASVSY